MNARIENSISRIFDGAQNRCRDMIVRAKQRTGKAAGQVRNGKKPVKAISKLGLKLTAVSHRTTDKVLKQQAKAAAEQIDAIALRLRTAADATSVKELLADQLRMIPENAALLADNARETFSIVAGAGGEVGDVFKNTMTELRGIKTATQAPRRKATGKSAASGKTTAKQKTAA